MVDLFSSSCYDQDENIMQAISSLTTGSIFVSCINLLLKMQSFALKGSITMKNKKVSGSFLTILVIIMIALVGCGDSSNGSGEDITLDMFQFKVENKDELEDLVKEFEDEHSNIKINVKTVGGGDDYGASLKTTFSSGEYPHIFNVGGPSDVEEYQDYLVDLTDTDAAEAALDGMLNAVTRGDEVYGLPFNQEGYGLIYNKNVFEDLNINPDEIVTFDDLVEAVELIDQEKDTLDLDAVFALPGNELWVLGQHISNMFFASEFDNDITKAYEAETIAFEKGDELKRYIDLQDEYSVQPTLSLDYSQQVEQLFSLEKVAMIQQGNWIYNSIYEMDPDFAENDIGILPVPVEGFEGKIQAGVPMFWAVNNEGTDAEIQASKDFLDWMYTSETGKTAVLEDFKFIPAYADYDSSKIADPLAKTIYEFAENGETMEGWVYQASPTGWDEEVLGVNIQNYLSGGMEWDEVISDSIEKWEEIRE